MTDNDKIKEIQNEFVEQLCDNIDYWHNLSGKTIRERIEGAVFSTLVMLDGGCPAAHPFAVRPIDEDGDEGEDIAGYLHELFCQKRSEPDSIPTPEAGL
jgi:hypothetical protein